MTRLSPVLSRFDPAAFTIGEVHGMRIATAAHAAPAGGAFIADLSAIRKRLCCGRGAPAWLGAHGVEAPAGLLQCRALPPDGLIARIHDLQYLVSDASHGVSPCAAVFDAATGRDGDALLLDYECAEFAIGGAGVAAVLAELCPMNLAHAPQDTWIATRFAHCEVAIRAVTARGATHQRIVCSPADARYLFDTLVEALRDHGGTALGFDDYLKQHVQGET